MGIIKSVASVVRGNAVKTAVASLFELNPQDDTLAVDGKGLRGIQFQYFPENISISRAVDYQVKDVLGGSHPIYQWLTGTEKAISFKAQFTSDEPTYGYDLGAQDSVLAGVENLGAAIGGLVRNPLSTAIALGRPIAQSRYQFNLQKAANYLLSLTYPEYDQNINQSSRVKPPPKLFLHFPNMGMSTKYNATNNYDYNGMYVLLRSCDIEFTSFFRNGEPRTMEISLSFIETVQVGKAWGFVSRSQVVNQYIDRASGNANDAFAPQLTNLQLETSTNVTKNSLVGSANPANSIARTFNNFARSLGVG